MPLDATLLTAVRTIALELAIPAPSTCVNPNQQVAQLIAQVNRAGEILRDVYNWPQLRQMYSTIPGVGSTKFVIGNNLNPQSPYTCCRVIPETEWDSGNHWRMIGPVTDAEWAQWQYGVLTQPIRFIWRMVDYQTVEFFPAMPSGTVTQFSVSYIVNEWATTQVVTSFPPTTPTTSMSKDADVHLFRPRLLIVLAKRNFLEAKGLPFDDAHAEYQGLLDASKGFSRSSRNLSLSQRNRRHFVDYQNVPETGYGQ